MSVQRWLLTTEYSHSAVPSHGAAFERYDLLGYDVADWDLLEAASLAPVWAPLLNEWHLFDHPEDATAYAAVTAQRVPEHAPFFGYGIYQLG